jgi:GT2 family glycosyltransferase
MKVAVLMACYNRVVTTCRSLEMLYALTDGVADIDVFLVDDASPDCTGAIVKVRFPRVKVIEGTGNLYWAKGMRLAWEMAKETSLAYDFYLWLNDDLMLKADSLKGLLVDWEACGDTRGVIVGACSGDETEENSSYAATDERDRQIFPDGKKPQLAKGWFNGNCVLVPRATYEAVGMISGDYSHARADYDYAERLKRAGIPFFASSHFVGVCNNDLIKKHSGKSLWTRIQIFGKPGYWNLADLFRFRYRYWGLPRAVLSVCHLILQVIFCPPHCRA